MPTHETVSAGEFSVDPAADPAVWVPCPALSSSEKESAGTQYPRSPSGVVNVEVDEPDVESGLTMLMYWTTCHAPVDGHHGKQAA